MPTAVPPTRPPNAICHADADMYRDCRNSICSLIRADPANSPTLVRLAWHASSTYTQMTNRGESFNGTIGFPEVINHIANVGLLLAMSWLTEFGYTYDHNLLGN